MSTRINTNVTALMAANNLALNSDKLSGNIARLSSGMRINSAADDPAGLVISTNMKAQITGLDQATSNTNDAINMIKTGEGALSQVDALLMSMRQLAVHASNAGVNSAVDVAADQTQIASAISSINRISSATQFGTKKLLDGSASSAATTTSGSIALTGQSAAASLTVATQGSYTTTAAYDTASVTGATQSTVKTSAGTALNEFYQGTVNINGAAYIVGSAGNGVNLTTLNSEIQASGYVAVQDTTSFAVAFVAQAAGATGTPNVTVTGLNHGTTSATATTAFTAGTVTQGTNALISINVAGAGALSSSSVQNIGGTNYYSFSNGLVLTSTTIPTAVAASAIAGQTGSGTAQVSANLLGVGAKLSAVAGVTTTGNDLEFQVGANGGQTSSQSIQSTAADQLGKNAATYTDANGNAQTVLTDSLKDLNVSTFKGAQDAIAVIDKAITDISSLRANLGAFQANVLQSNVASLSVASENLKASESTIVDTNLSTEIVDYTKNQILVQAATSALGQANQAPQAILKLLQ